MLTVYLFCLDFLSDAISQQTNKQGNSVPSKYKSILKDVNGLTSLLWKFLVSFSFEAFFFIVTLFLLLTIAGVGVAETAAGSSGAVFNCRINSRLDIDAVKISGGPKFLLNGNVLRNGAIRNFRFQIVSTKCYLCW